jgi:small-conductance mechanosensitive channel
MTLSAPRVAKFTQWSILSNITSGIVLFFSFPFKIGDVIRIHDKDFPIEGEIEDIRAFHIYLKTKDSEMIIYPNSLLLQKGISIIKSHFEDQEFTD